MAFLFSGPWPSSWVVLFFRLKFAHRICGVGAGVGMRNAGPTGALFSSTPCVIRDKARRIAVNIAKLPDLV